jgi:hypothetical protein
MGGVTHEAHAGLALTDSQAPCPPHCRALPCSTKVLAEIPLLDIHRTPSGLPQEA